MNALPPPIQPEGPNDPHGNDGNMPPDPAMDSLLREWLGEETPPNLLRNLDAIHDAAKNRLAGTSLFSNEELLAAVNRAFQDVEADHRKQERVRTLPRHHSNPYTRWGALALAASLLGVMTVYPFWRSRDAKKPLTRQIPTQEFSPPQEFPPLGSGSDSLFEKETKSAVAQSDTKGTSSSKPDTPKPSPSPTTDTVVAKQPVDNPPGPTEPKIDTPPAVVAQAKESRSPKPSQSGLRSDPQVVAVIDQQLEHLWTRLKIPRSKTTDSRTLEDRLAFVLIGRLPTDAEREWGRKNSAGSQTSDTAKALARRWMESEEFDRHWAMALSDYYLDLSMPVHDKDALFAFDAWLRESLQQNESIGQIEGRLIGSDMRGSDASAFWLRRWIAAGKKSPGKLLAASDRSPAGQSLDQWSALETLALQSSRISGVPVVPVSSMALESLSTEPLLGNAAALASVFTSDQTKPTDKKGFYVSDAEGKVTLVPPLSPDGKPLAPSDDPRANLAKWFEDSSQARRPMIDFVWKRLIGQPLVPNLGLTEAEGLEDRKDLLDFLASEAQSQRASLRQIVSWIAMSSPLYFESRSINAQEFLTLDPSNLASIQKQSRLFAAYPSTKSESTPVLDRLTTLSGWMKTSADNPSSSVLAQPATIPTGAKNSAATGKQPSSNHPADQQSALAWTSDRLGYEIANLSPYDRIREAASELASSAIDWDGVVERVFLVSLSRYPTAEERKLTGDLLELSQGNRQMAITRLLNTLLGPY